MQPFDDDYLARREKQIKDMFQLLSSSVACLITGLILGVISVLLIKHGGSEFVGRLLFVFSLLFGAGSIFMFASYFAERAANRAIQREREQLLALYGQKPKRGDVFRLSDDGEIVPQDSEEDGITHKKAQG